MNMRILGEQSLWENGETSSVPIHNVSHHSAVVYISVEQSKHDSLNSLRGFKLVSEEVVKTHT